TLVPGTSVDDPTTNLSTVNNSPVGAAKDDLKNKAKEKLGNPLPQSAPLPDQKLPDQKLPDQPLPGGLPAPVGGLRGPTSSDIAKKVGARALLYNAGGEALAQPEAGAVAGSLTGANHH